VSGSSAQLHRYVSPAQASELVGVSIRTLRRAIAAGRLRARRLGRLVRIDVAELTRWVESDGSAAAPAPQIHSAL
jgi:excisionase family DNA binding protein